MAQKHKSDYLSVYAFVVFYLYVFVNKRLTHEGRHLFSKYLKCVLAKMINAAKCHVMPDNGGAGFAQHTVRQNETKSASC